MVTKEESPIEKEWSRWSTSFSSVPAFTHWERDTDDWGERGRGGADRKLGGRHQVTNDGQVRGTYRGTVGDAVLLPDHHCVDHTVLLLLHHRRLKSTRSGKWGKKWSEKKKL